jgi:hypothetical protein
MKRFVFGRNEPMLQHWHRLWADAVSDAGVA